MHARPTAGPAKSKRIGADATLQPLLPLLPRGSGISGGLQHEREQRPSASSHYKGVSWDKRGASWRVEVTDPQTKRRRQVGNYASEEDAARAYDCAAVQARGPGIERNFPGEAIGELPVTVGERRKQRSSSRYIGVSWDSDRSTWCVQVADPQTKRQQRIGRWANEEDAARAYDCAAVWAHGSGTKLNFPGEQIGELPVSQGDEWMQRNSTRYPGVCSSKKSAVAAPSASAVAAPSASAPAGAPLLAPTLPTTLGFRV
jgi:hypothetical protein